MNYRNEKYPKKIQDVIKISEKVLSQLDFKSAPFLKEIKSDSRLMDKIPAGAGLYIFIEKGKAMYVGISRKVRKRLVQHGWGKVHNHATLAYLITEHDLGFSTKKSQIQHAQIKIAQERLKNCRVITIPVPDDDPFLLYFMEVYLSGSLKTKWNTFKTH